MSSSDFQKILVIKPNYPHWPIGLAYVLSLLESNKIPFDFIDFTCSHSSPIEMIQDGLKKNKYFAVASGGLIAFDTFFKNIARLTHEYGNNIPFILGGNISKDCGSDILFNIIGIDFGVIGEAETSFIELINAIRNNNDNDLCEIPGILYRNAEGGIVRNAPKRLDLNKNDVQPAWNYFNVDYYINSGSIPFIGSNIKYMPVLTGRGCVGKCTFCSPSIGGFRQRPIKDVIREIVKLSSKYKFDYIMFYNEMFYPSIKGIKEFCTQYMQLNDRKPWIAQLRVDSNVDVETFLLMKEAGCVVVTAGIESGSDKILELMNKQTTSEQIRRFFRNAKTANMPANGTFIIGAEGETEEDMKKTIDLIIEEEINTGESLLYVYPGTKVYDNALKKGLIKNEIEHLGKKNTGVLDLNFRNSFFNVTEMSDTQFLDVAIRELRRHNTFVFNRYSVQDLICVPKGDNVTLIGKCKECNNIVEYSYKNLFNSMNGGLLGIGINNRNICPKCFKELSFNIYESENMNLSQRYLNLKEKLSEYKKIVIGGLNQDTLFLIRINLFDMDYNKICGVVDFTQSFKDEFFINYPNIDFEDIIKIEPDCILMVDRRKDALNKLKNLYMENNIAIPEILYL